MFLTNFERDFRYYDDNFINVNISYLLLIEKYLLLKCLRNFKSYYFERQIRSHTYNNYTLYLLPILQ